MVAGPPDRRGTPAGSAERALLARPHRTALRTVAAVLGLAGVSTYAALLVDGWAGEIVWATASPTSTRRSTKRYARCCQPSGTTPGIWSGRRCSPCSPPRPGAPPTGSPRRLLARAREGEEGHRAGDGEAHLIVDVQVVPVYRPGRHRDRAVGQGEPDQ